MKLTDELIIDLEVAFNGTNQETSSENRSADEFNISTKLDEKTSFHHSPYKKRKSISKIIKEQSLSPIKGGKISKGKIEQKNCPHMYKITINFGTIFPATYRGVGRWKNLEGGTNYSLSIPACFIFSISSKSGGTWHSRPPLLRPPAFESFKSQTPFRYLNYTHLPNKRAGSNKREGPNKQAGPINGQGT